jgi:arylsulfatase A-like enzyme
MVKPSFLLVLVDCLRADLLARPRDAWPRASALVAGGVRFANAYTTCPTTTPAVTALFTGRPPSAHGVRALRGARLPDDVPTIAEELARGGYRTWASVTGPLLDTVGLLRGFEEVEYRDVPERSVHGPWGERVVARVREDAAGDRPFFGVVHVWDMHTPRSYPRVFDEPRYGRTAYDRSLAGIDAWLGRLADAAGDDTLLILTGDHGENVNLEPRSLRQQGLARRIRERLPVEAWASRAVELGAVSESKVLLRRAPRYFWNHNQTLFEGDVRVPLVFSGPDVRAGVRATAVSHVDLAPTLAELAGLAVDGWEGTTLAASVRDGVEPPAHPIVMEVPTGAPSGVRTMPQQAIREGSWKLITSLEDERIPDALYDLVADPKERRNVARKHPEVVARLKERLRELTTERADADAMSEEDDAILAARLEELGYL